MSTHVATPFDPMHPLAHGVAVVEASAGTGKTHNITNLVVRLVAERGVPLRRILIVTFTRAATAELKDRVRRRLGQSLAVLLSDTPEQVAAGDDFLTALRGQADRARAERGEDWARRLRDALEAFDEAFVSTIHGFCQRMLQQNAFESDADFDLELVADPGPVLEEIVDDVLSRELYAVDAAQYAFLVGACGFTREPLLKLARRAIDDPDVEVVPAPDAVGEGRGAALAQAFLASAPGWVDEVAAAVEAAQADGLFKKRQRTYKKETAAQRAGELHAWLTAAPDPTLLSPPAAAVEYFFDHVKMGKQLADPGAPFTHPHLDALRPLLAHGAAAASARRAAFVTHVRAEVDRRNAERRVQTYQDLMRGLARRLRAAPDDPQRRDLIAAIGARFDAALIDEFQDTDNLQWTIFRTLFGAGGHYLYLIGDPKQAIYGFRGANVHVYLDAKRAAATTATTATMTRNWRSDAGYVAALNHLMDHAGFFGVEGIPYERVDTPPREPQVRLRSGHGQPTASLQLRFVDARLDRNTPPDADPAGFPPLGKGAATALLPRRVAEDIVALLESGARVYDPAAAAADADAADDGSRPIGPGDVAVLVRKGVQARAIAEALRAAGVPAVRSGAETVVASEEARHLLLWLEAVAEGGRDAPARAAILTPLFGATLERLRAVDDEVPDAVAAWERWLEHLARWQRQLDAQGLMPTVRAMMAEHAVAERLLRYPDGERRLTNLRHLIELLHTAEREERLGAAGLVTWLRRQRETPSVDAEALELRLERDDAAVKVVTMHAAKGLEYRVVFAPYLWDGRLLGASDQQALVVPREGAPTERILDVHVDAKAPPKDAHLRQAAREAQRENLRLLYVALTRAKHRAVVYTGHIKDLATSPLAAALYGDQGGDQADRLTAAASFVAVSDAPGLLQPIEALAASSPPADGGAPTIAVSVCAPPRGLRYQGTTAERHDLEARPFVRAGLDHLWRRHSYSALTRGLHDEASATGAPPPPLVDPDRDAFDADDVLPAPHDLAHPSSPTRARPAAEDIVPLSDFPGGTDAGLFLHEIFEQLDFTQLAPEADDAAGQEAFTETVTPLLDRHGFAPAWLEALRRGFTGAVRAPLGGPLGARRLCDVPRGDRLDELRFDVPLAGGTAHGTAAHPTPIAGADLARAFTARPGDDKMSQAYIDGLAELTFGELAGFLTGSIDLAFREGAEPDARWFVVDYKSNRIDPERTGQLTVQHYASERLRWEMEQHHYYIQYHLYTLALHRYLRWRIGPDYRYERHLGGVYYLFFRGMVAPEPDAAADGPHPGVFFDRPPFSVIDALDRLFGPPSSVALAPGGPR